MKDNCMQDFLNKNYTDLLKGFCIIAIIIGHLLQCIHTDIPHYKEIFFIFSRLCTISVAVFFLLSGYGNIISVNKSEKPALKIYTKIFRLYKEFTIAILFFILAYFILFKNFSVINLSNIFNCIITMTIPDFSWWYIKIQAIAYVILLVSLFLNKKFLNLIVFMLTVGLISFLILKNFPEYWYQTILYFPAGCLIGTYRQQISDFVREKINHVYLAVLGIIAAILMCIKGFVILEIFLILGILFILILSVYNIPQIKLINICGKYSLELYIYHLVFILLYKNLTNAENLTKSIMVIISAAMIVIILHYYRKIQTKRES